VPTLLRAMALEVIDRIRVRPGAMHLLAAIANRLPERRRNDP